MYLFTSVETRGYLFYALGYNPGLLYFSGCSSMLLFKLQNKESQANLSCVKEPVLNADKFSNMTSFFRAEPRGRGVGMTRPWPVPPGAPGSRRSVMVDDTGALMRGPEPSPGVEAGDSGTASWRRPEVC